MNYTPEAVRPIIEKYSLDARKVRNNIQVQFPTNTLKDISDEEKCLRLVRAAKALREAGYPEVEVRLSHQDQNNRWVPWPCVWVNTPDPKQEQATRQMSEIQAMLGAVLGKLGISQEQLRQAVQESQGDEGVVEEPYTEPEQDDIPL